MEEEEGDKPQTAQKDEETVPTAEDSTTSPQPAQVEGRPSHTSPSPESPADDTGGGGNVSRADLGTDKPSSQEEEGKGRVGEKPDEDSAKSTGDFPVDTEDSAGGQGTAEPSDTASDQQAPDQQNIYSSVTSDAPVSQPEEQADQSPAEGNQEAPSAPVNADQPGTDRLEPATPAPEQTLGGEAEQQGSATQDSTESSAEQASEAALSSDPVPSPAETREPEPDTATDPPRSKSEEAVTDPLPAESPDTEKPCEEAAPADIKQGESLQDSAPSQDTGAGVEASEDKATEDKVHDTVRGEDNTDQEVVPEITITTTESPEVNSDLTEDSTPKEVSAPIEQESQAAENSQASESEPKTEPQDYGEKDDLHQATSLIVQESITRAVKVLSEDLSEPEEGPPDSTEGEAAESDKPSDLADTRETAETGLSGQDPEQSASPGADQEETTNGGEEELAPTQEGEAPELIKESFPVASTSSSDSPSLEKETELHQEPPEEEDRIESEESTGIKSDVDSSQAVQTSDTDKDTAAASVDHPADTEEKADSGTSDQLDNKVPPAAEESAPLPVAPQLPSGSDSASLSSTASGDASSVRKSKKKGPKKKRSSDRKVTFKSPSPDTMGAGASRDGEIEEADPRFAAQSTAAMSTASGYNAGSPPRSPGRAKNASLSQQSSLKSAGHMSMARASRFNMDGFEDAEVRISSDGFNIQEITIMEGQMVRFLCDQSCPNNATLLQVIYDGEELRPVIGGFQVTLDDHHGVFQQQLNLEGEYKFALSGIRCTPLMIRVRRKTDLLAEVTDEGFSPEVIYVDQGSTVRWSWKQTAVPHTITEVNYVFDKGCLNRQPASQSIVATTNGTHRQTFNRPGLHYFRTEGAEPGKTHLCIVCVHAVSREYRIEILDRSFQPMILLIEEGDRVWFSWDRFKCKKSHSVYQIEPPGMDHNDDDAYEPAQDGFKWTTPSKQGLMSYRFDKVGVFYFSDQNFEEAAEYIGTIIVKPKQREHVVKLQQNGFAPDLLRVMTGDRVWWLWDGQAISDVGQGLLLLEEDKVLNPLSRKNNSAEQSEHYQDLDAACSQLLTRVGASTMHFTTVGVYTYKLSDVGDTFNSCSVLVNPGSKNHTVHLTDNGFEPKVITVNCNDRVWWVWQSGKRQHNVVQVSHQGLPIPGGFCSGQPRDSPSAFAHQFSTPGVYYFISKSLPQVFGAVVVSTRPQVHEVMVKDSELKPDPVTVQLNDVVAWVFGSPRQFDVTLVKSVDEVLDTGTTHRAIAPRRCFARGISHTGTCHFKSKSFQKKKESNFMEETRLSSVVCDDRSDSIIIQLDKKGFHPNNVYLQKGHSLLWSWKGTDEEHNIIHVTDPSSATPLNMIKGPRAFNSGRPLPNDSFLYTFDEDGSYTVVSQGAPGFSCTVHVMEVARRTGEPYISSEQTGGTVDRYTKIHMASKTSGAKIYYTLDGSRPSINSKLYRPDRGVTLRASGLNFVRAVAAADQHLQSHIFTSKRFWVLSKGDDDHKSDTSVSDHEMTVPPQTKTWDWWNSKPQIKGCFTSPGTLEVFWDAPDEAVRKQIKSYQIFLNGVSYCQKFPGSTNSLKLVGLAGGRKYKVSVQVYPQHSKNQIVESNQLQLTCPKVAPPGGPVISLETTSDPQTLSVVWMSIDSDQQPIDGYLVYLNDQQCGPKLVPESGSNRCKVVISGCNTAMDYKLYVLAVSADTDETRMSNVLVVQLPLDTSNIVLPPANDRQDDEEVYLEYIEVLEGSGYLPQMDDPKNKGGVLKKTPAPASSESETETETDSETGSTETDSETESETDSEPLPETRRLKQQGAVKLGSHVTDGVQQAAATKKVVEVETGADPRKKDTDAAATSTPRIGGLVDDDTTSDSETESESDYESDAEHPPGGHVVILDASKNQATDTKENLKGRAVGEKGHYRDFEETDGMAVVGRGGRSGKKRHGKATALIEVQKTVALDMDERQVRDTGDIMEKTKLAVSTEQKSMIQVKEGELVSGDGDGLLPAPSIMATTKGKHSVRVAWELPRQPDPQYRLQLFVVNVVGTKFSSEINSDISYECNLVEKGKQVRGVQHCWNIQDKQQCVIKGLQPGLTYRIYVICNYSTHRGNKPCEIQTTSSVLYYTTLGPPKAPRLRVVRVDLYQACIAWEAPSMHENARLRGYQIQVDGKPLGGLRNPDIEQMVINNLVPGKTISINVVAVMARAAQESAPSKTIHITCPRRPAAPTISQQPSYKRGCVLLAWDKPRGHPDSTEETITAYAIYVDGQWHGEVKASRMGDQQGYQFFLTDLAPEQSYDVSVKAIAGDRSSDPDAQHVYCLSESFMSNIVPVMAPAAPKSPKLRLEGLHPDGIDVTWQTPQQSGDAHISGYQMLKNGKLYGSIIPSDVNSLRIRDVSLGEKLTLQLIALTEHPVGKGETRGGNDKDSGISGSTAHPDDRSAVTSPTGMGKDSQKVVTFTRHVHINDTPNSELDVFAGERYSGCKPGPKLVVHYTGLVCPPAEVWCERANGHSALIVWSRAEERKAHYVSADSYQVTWWPGDRPHDEINSDSTTDDHLLITSLRPATTYTVVVEARKMEKYTDMDEAVSAAETPDGLNAFILSSKSEYLTVKTACPPDPPHNVGISATTCNSLNIAWDPPLEHGSEVIAIRIECISLNAQNPHHVTEDIMPDSTSADITGLHEKTDYLVRVVAVTEEYFDRLPDKHKHKKLHAIPRDVLVAQEESPWLPSASIVAKTAGTEAPANIRLNQSTMTSLVLTWTPPLVYGSNKLLSQIVRWRDVRRTKPSDPEDLIVASHVNLLPTEDTLTISDLVPGSQYQIVIEAVVSIKTSLNPDQWDSGIEKFRRTAHVMSKPLVVWTRAPIEPPRLLVQSYDMSSAVLYWEKPILMSIIGKDEEGNPRYLRRYLEGYRLEINGKVQSCLGPQAQTCTLTKCKPGKTYSVVLVAMTCTEDRRRERKEKFKGYFKTTAPQDTDYVGLLDDELLDEAPSEPVEISLPKSQDGFMETAKTSFVHQEERDSRTFGDVDVVWTVQGQSNLLKQFSIIWFSSEDRVVQTKYVGPEKRRATIPVTHLKSIYTITVEPCYYTDVLPQQPQDVHIMVPGPPDAPEIFLRSQDKEEFVIEWGEPRCFGGVKVKGYQVYMNDKKVGNELSNSHRKAVIPCRMNKMYRINLVALSSNPDYQDSHKSNTLVINSGKGPVGQGDLNMEEQSMDGHDLPVKVTGVTESGIHLDWSAFVENQDVAFYKIQWSSVAQPAQREVRLSAKDISCVINKCLPGTTHFVRLLAYNEDGTILEKSKQLTVQTSAPPDAPVLSVRACNFRYIAVQWDKPTTYGDALITGYKVYVNGIVEAVLSADSLSFTFTQGKWCQEFSFQVQALTAGDQLNSKPSEPLILTWPGTKAPQIRRIPSVSSSSLRVSWTAPYLTDGVRVKHFKLCCVEEDTEKLVQSVGPIHPDTCEAEFKHLKKGSYMVYLETHLYGTGEIVRSDPIRMQPSVCPDPPQISVTVVGLEERRQLEKLTCDLANKRDRLIRAVGHKLKRIGALAHPLRAEKDDDVLMGAHTLTGVEELLETCFQTLENYTGQLIAHVSWQCPQTNEDVHLSGFKVLVDGKQYGSSMHAGVRTVRLQLGLEEPSYRLSMVALSDKPQGSSVESSVVELLSAPFRPFSYYCYHTMHTKGSKWPGQGCCKYQDSLNYERQAGKKLANQGLLNKHVPPPACSLLDIFAGDYKPLMKGHRPNCPTVLLFWTPWCLSSSKMMDFYIRFAREASKEFNFVAVSCGVSGVTADDRQTLVHQLTSGGWREDGVMWHCTSECASNVYRTLSTINQTTSSLRLEQDLVSEKYMDLTELLGIAGVPTFLFIHPEGYISWHGRYSSFDYAAFSAFMRHTNSEVMRHPCPVFNCDCCKNDMTIEQDAVAALLPEKGRTPQPVVMKNDSETNLHSAAASRTDLKYAAINGFTESASGTDRVFMARKPSPKRRPKLSINRRPYSASATPQQLQGSPYLAKVVPAAPQTRSRNRPVSAKTIHYM
ncbi:uncharacterized protein LOC143284653 isoform X3 [Babylonia areolata]|uniref:uncharacterized protein LOC143284653 isoform X3 n=1 Tax=Babylonia areolata TaxID=304850 RepID=UPI003FD1D644